MRLVLSLCMLLALAGGALWFHESLGASQAAASSLDLGTLSDGTEDRLSLRLGGQRPVLRLPDPAKQRDRRQAEPRRQDPAERERVAPRPIDRRPNGPRPLTPPRRPVFDTLALAEGETVSELVRRHYGNSRRLNEVMRYNGLDDDSARRLQPGTVIKLPR